MTLAGQSTFGSGLSDSYRSHSSAIREGKRACDMDDDEAPRAKRRFEKVNAKFERFSISGDDESNRQPEMDTSDSEEDDDDWLANDDFTGDSSSEGIVEEPNEDSKQLFLNECLQRYIERMKQTNGINLPTRGAIQGHELVVWRPLPVIKDPFDDPTMKGRIQELDHADNSCEGSTSEFIVDGEDSDSETDTMSAQFDSPQPYKSRIEELTEQDDECMEMECD
ncbi:hypothetical protein V3C99_002977 [Haemonchus contortus]|nr:Hypothetical protein CBG06824 [Haemonchus contortus]